MHALDNLFDAWLSYEHPASFRAKQTEIQMEEAAQRDSADLSAGSMTELLSKLRQNADMELQTLR